MTVLSYHHYSYSPTQRASFLDRSLHTDGRIPNGRVDVELMGNQVPRHIPRLSCTVKHSPHHAVVIPRHYARYAAAQ
jgi:hypothetical protein